MSVLEIKLNSLKVTTMALFVITREPMHPDEYDRTVLLTTSYENCVTSPVIQL
jgi:hypothetical protein